MSPNGVQTKTFQNIVGQIKWEDIAANPAQVLKAAGLEYDSTWEDQVKRLKERPESLQDLETLKSIRTEPKEVRRQHFRDLARKYQQFGGWEGIAAEEPGW